MAIWADGQIALRWCSRMIDIRPNPQGRASVGVWCSLLAQWLG
ncbi:hypothetical protein HMPREF9622_02159 [Cutibacterium modestum HL037PA3]|nr:hypothetical protein HMPREF9622_02159 [Cutibacterium modestum HL037PA3]